MSIPNQNVDWNTLADVNFIINKRMTSYLNAALAATSLVNQPEAADKPDGFWEERALTNITHALELHSAWASLVRYKAGESLLPQHKREFEAGDMLRWLAAELKLGDSPSFNTEILSLTGNRETLQEALLLLYSCAYTLGPSVHLRVQKLKGGVWFRVMYGKTGFQPGTLDGLIESMLSNWRSENAAFELMRAQDFVNMNGYDLVYTVRESHCELAFFVTAVSAKRPPAA